MNMNASGWGYNNAQSQYSAMNHTNNNVNANNNANVNLNMNKGFNSSAGNNFANFNFGNNGQPSHKKVDVN